MMATFCLPSAASAVNDFRPGEEMIFPLKSKGVSEQMVKAFSVNCKSKVSERTAACEALLQKRGAECSAIPPEVFDDKGEYRLWAGQFTKCIFPKPICAGVEVSSAAECAVQE